MLQDVGEQRLGDTDRACESDIGAVQSGYKGQVRQTAHPRSDHTARKPPVSMNELRLEVSARPHCVNEIGPQEPDECELCGPGSSDVARHVAGVCETLVSAWRIPEALDKNALEYFGGWQTGAGGGPHPHADVPLAQRPGEAGGVSSASAS